MNPTAVRHRSGRWTWPDWLRSAFAVAVVATVSVVALVVAPSTTSVSSRADHVIIMGVPGLRWDDVSPSSTPVLWRLAERGSIGALAVRSADNLTCPADGWLTLGAGNLASWIDDGSDESARPSMPGAGRSGAVTQGCPPVRTDIDRPDAVGARVTAAPDVVDHNRRLAWGAQPGALAESVGCTMAIGPGAAVAAARPIGRVDRYLAALPDNPASSLAECALSIVDLGTVAGTGAARAAAVAEADSAAGMVVAGRPERSLVLVAGLSDTAPPARLHVAIADGPGYGGGWLGSSSTGRPGYVQLFDLSATALAALDKPQPARLFAGGPAGRFDGRPGDVAGAIGRLIDSDVEAVVVRDVASRFFVALVLAELLLLACAVPLLWRARAGGRRLSRSIVAGAPLRRRIAAALAPAGRPLAEVTLAAAGLAVPAALAADLVWWWRSDSPGLVFTLVWAGLLAVATVVVLARPLRRRPLGAVGVAAALAAAVVVVDMFSGSRLQLGGVGGYSVVDGGRFSGIGTVGLGVFVAGLMVAAGALAQHVARRHRPVIVAVFGCAGIVIVGSPYLGSDAAGAIALMAGVCVSVVMATGGWLTVTRLGAAVAAGLVVTTAFAGLGMARPLASRGTLEQLVTSVRDGTAGLAAQRVSAANVVSVATSPLSALAVGAALFVFFVLMQHWGGLRRLFGIYPALRAVCAGLAVAALLGGLLNGAGLIVAGAAAATALPLVTLAALTVIARANEPTPRTRVTLAGGDGRDTSSPHVTTSAGGVLL